MSYKPNRRFDVGVIGGGPAGLTVAYVLACLGLEVLVLEASPCPQQKAGECLPPSAADLLQRLGLLSVLQGQGRCYGIRSIWGSDTPVERNYLFHPYGPGWLLDRRQFEQSMAEHAEKRGVELAWGSVFEEAVKTKTGWSLAWNSETQEVRFIIDASGRNARFSRRQGRPSFVVIDWWDGCTDTDFALVLLRNRSR